MRKHIFGIAIFTLIVGSAVLISSLFVAVPKPNFVVVEDNQINTTKTSCFKMKRKPQVYDSSGIKIKQAVLNWNSKVIDWEIYEPETGASVVLHLFAKGSQGVRYIATEVMPIGSSAHNRTVKYSTVYISLNHFSLDENLYAVPELISVDDAQTKNFFPKFSEDSAAPVMINFAKVSRRPE